jgi:hypothetical protein
MCDDWKGYGNTEHSDLVFSTSYVGQRTGSERGLSRVSSVSKANAFQILTHHLNRLYNYCLYC